MSKFKIAIISIFTMALVILTSAVVYQNIKYDKLAKEEEKVTDECIYENNEIENDIDEIKVSETETKVSPNAELVIKKYYNECGHTTEEVREVTNDMVNKKQKEIEELYLDYKIESFDNDKIVLLKEEEGQCDEHYIVKDENSNIVIYKLLVDGTEEIYQNTGISTEYLPETDKISLRDGIKIFGRENLNSLIEDFE